MIDCLFCKIIDEEIPSTKVYEDESVLAFMNIQAINPGHTLVIPKKHVEEFYQLEDALYQKMMKVLKQIAKSQKKTYKPERVGIMVQGFEVAHAHIHVVPLFEITDITSKKLLESTTLSPSRDELEKEAKQIKNNISD